MKTIAVIDDDIPIGNLLEEILEREGYAVIRAYSGTEASMLLSTRHPQLVLLDLMLPGMSGEEVLSRIPASIPVIIVSARAEVQDRVQLLRSGAVDYVTKPFDIRELLARIDVHLRENPTSMENVLNVGCLMLDCSSHEVRAAETTVRLTKTEFAILKLLMSNPGKVLAKSFILNLISEDTPDCMESSLKVHVSNLRKKLQEASGVDCIEAVWGIGFRLNFR